MTEELVFTVGNEALLVVLKIALPALGVTLLVGILVSIFQAVTQIHELTLAFVPKILAVIAIGVLLGPWMVRTLLDFARELLWNLPVLLR